MHLCACAPPVHHRYDRASKRLEHLPMAVVSSVSDELMLVDLPGPKGVLGYEVRACVCVFEGNNH